MGLSGAAHIYIFFFEGEGGGVEVGQKSLPPYNLSQISYNDETWHSYTLPKEVRN